MDYEASKKSDTSFVTSGPASVPSIFEVLVTEGGARTTDGTEQTFADNRTTGETVNVGDVVKYVNLTIMVGPKAQTSTSVGWLEWAFVCHKEIDPDPPITNIGTETLGVICTRMYAGDCVFTGCVPMGKENPNCQNVALKIPKNHNIIQRGDQWHLYTYFRTVSNTETGTNEVKQVLSFNYKAYGR